MLYSVRNSFGKKVNFVFPVSIRKCTVCKCLLYVICECKHFIGKYRSTTSKLCNVLFLLGTFEVSYDGIVLLNIEPTSGVVDPERWLKWLSVQMSQESSKK